MNYARLCLGFMLVALAASCASAPPVRRGWEPLEEREVDSRVDHDVIEVGRSEGRFRELRFTVHGGAIELYEVKVILGDGDSFRPGTRFVFDRGEGRTIVLPHGGRVVRRVEFVYRSLRGEGRSRDGFSIGEIGAASLRRLGALRRRIALSTGADTLHRGFGANSGDKTVDPVTVARRRCKRVRAEDPVERDPVRGRGRNHDRRNFSFFEP